MMPRSGRRRVGLTGSTRTASSASVDCLQRIERGRKIAAPRHAGQNKFLLTIAHEEAAQIKRLIVSVRHGLRHMSVSVPQLGKAQRWFALVRYVVGRILASQSKPRLGPTALSSGQLRKFG